MAANPEDLKDLNPSTSSGSQHDPQEKIVEPKKEKEVLILDLSQAHKLNITFSIMSCKMPWLEHVSYNKNS